MASIKVEHSVDKPVVITYKRGNGKWKKLCTLGADESARRASKYILIVTGSSRPMSYNLKNGEAIRITKDSKVGRRYIL